MEKAAIIVTTDRLSEDISLDGVILVDRKPRTGCLCLPVSQLLTRVKMESQSPLRVTPSRPDQRPKDTCRSLTPSRPTLVPSGNVTIPGTDTPRCIRDGEKSYRVESLLGKGGFAKVYKLIEMESDGKPAVIAGKIISKKRISKPHNKDRIAREVDIHRKMKHENVVEFLKFFEDSEHVYILLEYCGTKTLSGIVKARGKLTEPESRYYLKQIIAGCQYIHSQQIVHRDLKLSNLFINEQMQVKIGDFGLSAYIDRSDDRKESICGTPNYLSPEVILKAGHSYPVDVWAIGCVLYAFLSGRPPFETQTLKETYKLITKSKYVELNQASIPVRALIAKCLRVDPMTRPSLSQISDDLFLTQGYTPASLPQSAVSEVPDFIIALSNNNQSENASIIESPLIGVMRYLLETFETQEILGQGGKELSCASVKACALLLGVITDTYNSIKELPDETSNPLTVSGEQCLWILKWVDYSHKYGFGFQLSNDVYGASFNDGLSITATGDTSNVGLHDTDGNVIECPASNLPAQYNSKYQTMLYFVNYMNETLVRGGDMQYVCGSGLLSETYMLRWLRNKQSVAMCLSTGTIQVNFLSDHTKLIVSRVMSTDEYQLMYINKKRQASVFNLNDIKKHGCMLDIKLRLQYAMLQLDFMLKQKS